MSPRKLDSDYKVVNFQFGISYNSLYQSLCTVNSDYTYNDYIVKSVTETTVIMVIRIEVKIFEKNKPVLAIGTEAWDDHRIFKVQSRSQR